MKIDITEMVNAGLSVTEIQEIIAKQIAGIKAPEPVKNATIVDIGNKIVAAGKADSADLITLALEVVKEKMPTVKELIEDVGFSKEEITELAKELDKVLKMYDQIFKIALESGVNPLTGAGKTAPQDITELLKVFAAKH